MRRVSRNLGFTLIELLVVIAIIAILAAILFPTFMTAQQNARSAKCQAHQKELTAALMMYTEAYGGKLPWIQFLTYHDFNGGISSAPWVHMVQLYQPYVKNFEIILCPAKQAYAYNECLCGSTLVKTNVPWVGGRHDIYRNANWQGRLLSSVKILTRTPAFFCAFRYSTAPGDYGPNGWGWEPEDSSNRGRMTNMHNGGANYGFLDGHSKWYRPGGGGFYMPVDGIDYDGNGTLGEPIFMR